MFSSGSSKFSVLHRRKMGNRGYRDRGPMLIPAVSEVQQRVKSAKILRVKNLQNQIAEAHLRINVSICWKKLSKISFSCSNNAVGINN